MIWHWKYHFEVKSRAKGYIPTYSLGRGFGTQEKVYSMMRASLSNIGHATAADNNPRQAIYAGEVEHLDYAATLFYRRLGEVFSAPLWVTSFSK